MLKALDDAAQSGKMIILSSSIEKLGCYSVTMDDGSIKVLRVSVRNIQVCVSLQGGIRYHQNVDVNEVKRLRLMSLMCCCKYSLRWW